ncbi:MAG: Riboflavin synthase [Chlamydiae bacterium]|nr:Riboflavin synthase [Chlamydiota bacterium]
MFTGIIEHIGHVKAIVKQSYGIKLEIESSLFSKEQIGKSFAVDGVCLTQTQFRDQTSHFDIMEETLDKTDLGNLKVGQSVHLEPAMGAQSSFDGHMVQGHVDGVAHIVSITEKKLVIELPDSLRKFMVPKGSIAIDGVSLTIAQLQGNLLTVALIPHTYKHTLFKTKKNGVVNIEIDLFAKTIFKYLDQIHLSEAIQ